MPVLCVSPALCASELLRRYDRGHVESIFGYLPTFHMRLNIVRSPLLPTVCLQTVHRTQHTQRPACSPACIIITAFSCLLSAQGALQRTRPASHTATTLPVLTSIPVAFCDSSLQRQRGDGECVCVGWRRRSERDIRHRARKSSLCSVPLVCVQKVLSSDGSTPEQLCVTKYYKPHSSTQPAHRSAVFDRVACTLCCAVLYCCAVLFCVRMHAHIIYIQQ